jgi:hypothetical protein
VGLLAGLDTTGVGYFSLFVSIVALAFAALSFYDTRDYPFAVIWTYWSFLWFLFFLVLGLGIEPLTRFTGFQVWITGVIPAFLLLSGRYEPSATAALALAVLGIVLFGGLWLILGRPGAHDRSTLSASTTATTA